MHKRLTLFVLFVSIFFGMNSTQAFKGYDEDGGSGKPPSGSGSGIVSMDYDLDVRNVKVVKAFGNSLYVGTPEGFYIYDMAIKDYEFFDYDSGLISRSIFSFTEDPDKKQTWIGTYGGGLVRFDGKNMKTYNVPNGLCDSFVYDVKFDSKGTMWIATWSGLNKVSGDINKRSNWDRFTVENTKKGLSDDWVYAIEIDKKDRVWLGTEVGISLLEGGEWKNWNHKDGMGAAAEIVKDDNANVMSALKGSHHDSQLAGVGQFGVSSNFNPNYVVSMKLGPRNKLWIGTWGGGLARFDTETKTFKNFTRKDGLPGNYILALEFDKDGTLWIGTNDGLSKFNGTDFTNYSEKDGLFSQFIFSIAFTSNNEMWLGGWKGVSNVLSIN